MRKYRIIEQTNCKGKTVFIPQFKNKGDGWKDFSEISWGSTRMTKIVKSSYKKALKVIKEDKQYQICEEKIYNIGYDVYPLTEGKEKRNPKKTPPLRKSAPPPPPPDRIIREGQIPPKPKSHKN